MNEADVQKITSGDPETQSEDILGESVAQLGELFPDAVVEGRIDFDVLRQLLGDTIEDREEKYGLNWHGKRRARQIALTPSTGTLRPCPDESVEWSTTQNLMIEGDNLEVLKLLQKSYAGKIKLIYIDPPYNTGKDFVYPDDFRDNIKNYLELTGQIDGGGRRLSTNTEASGRFHTAWLNMMYPRLKLARSLLAEDGLIFISVDDREVANLKAMCAELFGEDCLIEQVVWKNKYGSGALTRGFANVHEYILCFGKTADLSVEAPLGPEAIKQYRNRDEHYAIRGGFVTQPLATRSKDDRPNLRFPILWNGREVWPDKQWIWSKDRVEEAQARGELVFSEKGGTVTVRSKYYLRDENGVIRNGKPVSILNGPFNQEGTKEVDELLGDGVFSFPKPTALIRYLVSFVVNGTDDKDFVVLDFFAGSGTTGHAVLAQNAADGGTRRFILVQLPEALGDDGSSQRDARAFCDSLGVPQVLTELTKERLRRAGAKIRDDNPMFTGDTGFRVFKLDSTNIQAWDPEQEDLAGTLEGAVEHLKADRTEEDILYELLLKLGLDLCVPIESREIAGKNVRSVGGGALVVCLAPSIDGRDVEELANGIAEWFAELAPAGDATCVFRDSAFEDDVAKTNLTAILAQRGLTRVRSL